MNARVAVCSLLLFASWLALAAPSGRAGDAEVREAANGGPCFTISEREERRGGTPNFDAVTVTEVSGKGSVMWKMAMPPSRTFPVSFSMCIPYAGRVQALPQTPAAPLQPGKLYHVRIDARRASANKAASYEARFCLARQPDGSVIVHHIGRDDHEGRRLYGCLPRND
jgi:hypothetical protein